eukprot:COSAG05_NODE_344_length_11005_cov_35.313772_4_plen_101_part_00
MNIKSNIARQSMNVTSVAGSLPAQVLARHGMHWRLAQGQQLSIVRDGRPQLWDHDFDPVFSADSAGDKADAKKIMLAVPTTCVALIAAFMHIYSCATTIG